MNPNDPFADLIDQWEKRAETANKLANDAAGAGDWTTSQRCKTKAGVIRSMTQELKREILQANLNGKTGSKAWYVDGKHLSEEQFDALTAPTIELTLEQIAANNDTNMKTEMIKPSCRRMKDGWAPALEYDNGGVVIAAIRCGTMNEALREASEMLGCMSDYPDAFTHNHPAPNQMIDLSNDPAMASADEKTTPKETTL
jgi:hypothetical protein